MIKVTFDKGVKKEILDAFNMRVEDSGRIVEKNGDPILSPDGEDVYFNEFAGIKRTANGVKIIKNDLPSLIEHARHEDSP